jgi:hypothetical protein
MNSKEISQPEPPDLMDESAIGEFFGGTKPLSRATVRRYVERGWLPVPMKLGTLNRWRRTDIEAARAKLLAQ